MREIIKLAGTLMGICVAVALLLGIVNSITEPIILRMQEEKTASAMAKVLLAEEYQKIETTTANVSALYRAVSGGKHIGYVAEVSASGFNGVIKLVVGVNLNGCVTGVAVTQNKETKGVGTKVTDDPAVLNRFVGMSGTITVNSGDNRFDAITGATVTSKAVTAAVNTALAAVAAVQEQGGGQA